MEWYVVVGSFTATIYIVVNILFAKAVIFDDFEIEYFLNPLYIYEENEVNIFGCAVLTVLGNIFLAPIAICYWFCKLCTVGRKR